MDNNIIVSIIVPIYNTEMYLSKCIDSICNQSYPYLQIVLVDDQSTDNSLNICDYYKKRDSRITVIHQKNKGVSGARNTGLANSIGDYVMFVDSDDELDIDAVKLLLHDAIEYNADIVAGSQQITNQKGQIINSNFDDSISVFYNDEAILLSLKGDINTISACAKLFKRDFIEEIYFEEGKNIHEDGFFLFQCCLKKPVFVQHNICVYKYYLRSGSNSNQKFSDKYLSIIYFCEQKKALMKELFPQYENHTHNMEVRTQLQLLDVLCRTTDKKYKAIQSESIRIVKKLYSYHIPINDHHRKLAWIVYNGLYPLYKFLVRLKYYRD